MNTIDLNLNLSDILNRGCEHPLIEPLYNELKNKDEEIKRLKEEIGVLIEKLERQDDVILKLRKDLYGQSSEKSSTNKKSTTKTTNSSNTSASNSSTSQPSRIYKRTKAKNTSINFDSLEQHHVYKKSPQCSCPNCSGNLKYKSRTERFIKYIPGKLVCENVHYEDAICPNCYDIEGNPPKFKAESTALITNSYATPSLVAKVIVNKFQYYLPINRQESLFASMGIKLSKSTLNKWLIKISDLYFTGIYNYMLDTLLQEKIIYCDETTLRIIEENSRIYSYIFTLAHKSESKKITIYNSTGSRSKEAFLNLIGDYEGFIHTDGYAIYKSDDKIIIVNCQAHLRRKLVDIANKEVSNSLANQMLDCINDIFKYDQEIKSNRDLSNEQLIELKYQMVEPVINHLFTLIEENIDKVPPKSTLGNAFKYALTLKEGLYNYFKHGDLECSNNYSERNVKYYVMGRSNWLFCVSTAGAEMTATFYSIVRTAIANGVNPYDYIIFLLENININDTKIDYSKLVPWNEDIKNSFPYIEAYSDQYFKLRLKK